MLNIKHFSFDKCPLLFPVVFLKMTMFYFLSGINSKIMCYCFRKYKLLGTEYFCITKKRQISFLFLNLMSSVHTKIKLIVFKVLGSHCNWRKMIS